MTQDAIRVLLVEDNPGDARLVEETLAEVRSARFDLTHVTRLDDARQSLEKEQYDAVLLDLFLEECTSSATFGLFGPFVNGHLGGRLSLPAGPIVVPSLL